MKNFLNTVLFALVSLFFITFSLSNSQSIQLNFFGLLLKPIPVSLLVLIPFLVGVVLGNILGLAERFSLKREMKRLRKELKELKETLHPA